MTGLKYKYNEVIGVFLEPLTIKCKWLDIMHHAWMINPFSIWQYLNESKTRSQYAFLVNKSIQFTIVGVIKYIPSLLWNLYFSDITQKYETFYLITKIVTGLYLGEVPLQYVHWLYMPEAINIISMIIKISFFILFIFLVTF